MYRDIKLDGKPPSFFMSLISCSMYVFKTQTS